MEFPTSGCLGDAFEVPLQNPSHCHCPDVHKVLEAHVVDAAGGQDHVGARRQDLLDSLLCDVRFPADTIQLVLYLLSETRRRAIRKNTAMSRPTS